jgi:hypothetical protein
MFGDFDRAASNAPSLLLASLVEELCCVIAAVNSNDALDPTRLFSLVAQQLVSLGVRIHPIPYAQLMDAKTCSLDMASHRVLYQRAWRQLLHRAVLAAQVRPLHSPTLRL